VDGGVDILARVEGALGRGGGGHVAGLQGLGGDLLQRGVAVGAVGAVVVTLCDRSRRADRRGWMSLWVAV